MNIRKLRNQLEEVIFSEQFKKAKETKPELEDLEKWIEESEVGETSKEDYISKLEELKSMIGEEVVEPVIDEVD